MRHSPRHFSRDFYFIPIGMLGSQTAGQNTATETPKPGSDFEPIQRRFPLVYGYHLLVDTFETWEKDWFFFHPFKL